MEKLKAQLWLSDTPRCSGPLCQKVIKQLTEAVFLFRDGRSIAFCCPRCYYTGLQLHLEQRRASKEIKKKDLLKSMGYEEPKPEE